MPREGRFSSSDMGGAGSRHPAPRMYIESARTACMQVGAKPHCDVCSLRKKTFSSDKGDVSWAVVRELGPDVGAACPAELDRRGPIHTTQGLNLRGASNLSVAAQAEQDQWSSA